MADEKLPLILHPGSALVQVGPQGGRILAEMVDGALALSQAPESCVALAPRFRIGDHEFCDPDFQQILLWSKALKLEPQTVIERLLSKRDVDWEQDHETVITNGKFIKIGWDIVLLPMVCFEWVDGLIIEALAFFVPEQRTERKKRKLTLPLPRLRFLYCWEMGLSELDLSTVPQLSELNCDGNSLVALDLSFVPSLTTLFCNGNDLTSLDLYSIPQLTTLSCENNSLEELDLSPVTQLNCLRCNDNELNELDLTPVPKLTELHCFNVGLSEIDLSAVPLLTELNCDSNCIKKLDLSSVPQLINLHCGSNHIVSMDLSGLTMLEKLSCDGNQLAKLDLSSLQMLTELSCGNNHITALDLSTVPLLTSLSCSNLNYSWLDPLHPARTKKNRIAELDVRALWNLVKLSYDEDKTRLIQRPDQNF